MSFNNVIVEGFARLDRSGKFEDGTPWVNFSVNHSAWKGKDDDGKNKYESMYFDCFMNGGLAGLVADQLSKDEGHRVIVSGSLEQQRWETDGEKRSAVKLRIREISGIGRVGEVGGGNAAPKASVSASASYSESEPF